ncbi:S1 RNA-binding domain-containing protein [Pelosinus fermentans]|uniref:RNA-binding domain, S1 n=1 Tax=Pelosinus fermentans JBW45 TaxID=1192197 RepID=I9DCN6_9FIRM|nr:S1-like domain-containing RNA-binding protein [Pelosinus fermentans]AJQ27121.1 RNA-binding domain, S1 [Pelosinus fermentans JBW45]
METTNKLTPGSVVTLKAVRSSEFGIFLDAGTGNTNDDILLHKQQQTTDTITIGDEIPVYLYQDPKGRLTASMRLPKMQVGQVARVTVINTTRDGAFVDIGAERGVFMPFAGMRGNLKRGDKVWVKLYIDKSGRPAVSMEVEDELRRASVPATDAKIGDMITGSLYNYNEEGAFIFTKERYIAFMHTSEITTRPNVGDEITARITHIREDGRINVSMRPLKQEAIDTDGDAILSLLHSRNGKMPYSDDTSPEIIKEKFHISKSAFKRALGRLIKTGYVEQRDGWTYLLEKEKI